MQNPSTVEQPIPTPSPTAPPAPTAPTSPVPGGVVTTTPSPGRPLTRQEVQEIRARREELSDQLQSAAQRRGRLAEQLKVADPAARKGLEQRIAVLDERIVRLEQDIAETGRQLTSAQLTGSLFPVPEAGGMPRLDPGQITAIWIVFIVLVLFPLALATTRMLWKRATGAWSPRATEDTAKRLTQLEQAVDTVAVEMERVSEGQRFITKLLMEPNALASLEALGQRERAGLRRDDE